MASSGTSISSTTSSLTPALFIASAWAASGAAQAPRYRRISGTGTVEQITERAFTALA
jgi:adenylate kinase